MFEQPYQCDSIRKVVSLWATSCSHSLFHCYCYNRLFFREILHSQQNRAIFYTDQPSWWLVFVKRCLSLSISLYIQNVFCNYICFFIIVLFQSTTICTECDNIQFHYERIYLEGNSNGFFWYTNREAAFFNLLMCVF